MNASALVRFRTAVYVTLLLTYLLILAGAVVRTTQSGMGCPDWPKCFGQWIPPTDVSQLPPNYQEIYAHRGYADTAFDAYHTWVEYVNRLLGVLLGLSVFITLLLSLPFRKTTAKLFWLSFISFLLIGFQGWLGSLVVSSNLAPLKITLHMLMALVLLALLVYIYHSTSINFTKAKPITRIQKWIYLSLIFTVIQILLGTQVRQEIDVISKAMSHSARESWIEQLSVLFKVHRSFSILIFAFNAWIIYSLMREFKTSEQLRNICYQMGLVLCAELIVGIVLSYFAVPAALQPLHLLFASLLFGLQFRLALLAKE